MGIDLGTQSVRVIAVSANGDLIGAGSQPLASRRDGPRHEQDPGHWWSAVAAACRQAMSTITGRVRGVAVDATSGTVLLTDDHGRPVSAALMYDDTRATAEVNLVNDAGHELWNTLGYRRMQPSWALPKVLWLLSRAEDPQNCRVMHQSDYVNRRLVGGLVASDLSATLKTGCDLIKGCWPDEVMDNLGVPLTALPELVLPGTVLGEVAGEAADATTIPAGTPVIAGMTDGCAAQLGSGALSPGSWNSVIGTTLVVKGSTLDLIHDPHGVVYSHRSPDGGWLPGGASGTGAGALARELTGRDLDQLSRGAGDYEPSTVLAYPLASERGERFPFVAPDAHAFWLGTPTDDADLYAGLVQGISFIERLAFDYLEQLGAPVNGDLVLTGGATRSMYWTQLRATILNRPVTLVSNAEPALGMAILAASTSQPTATTAARMVHVKDRIDPEPDGQSRFTDSYLRLIDELERRGWLETAVAKKTQQKAAQ